MKKYVLSIIGLLGIFSLVAQSTNGTKNYNRKELKHVVSFEGGFKTLSGLGINYSYNINEIATIDAGVGLAFKQNKIGIQGRFHLMKTNFAPFIFVGFSAYPTSKPNIQIKDSFGKLIGTREIHSLMLGRFGVGFDATGIEGYNIRLNLGLQRALSDKISTTTYENSPSNTNQKQDKLAKALYGSGLSISLNIGYAF